MYIEFKLQSGRVPAFVNKHIPYVINSKYYGTLIEGETACDSTVELSAEQLESIITSAVLFVHVDSPTPSEHIFREMTTEEKIKLISEFL